MSNAQNGLPASDAVPASAESAPDDASGLGAGADGEAGGEFGMDDGADLGGHTLLSRPAAPQGRRSLFRR
jgi:hypothetical protein